MAGPLRRVLLVASDCERRQALERLLGQTAGEVEVADGLASGLRAMADRECDLVFCDVGEIRGKDAKELERRVSTGKAPLVVVTGEPDQIDQAVEAMRGVALDCLLGLPDEASVTLTLCRVGRYGPLHRKWARELQPAPAVSGPLPTVAGMVGDSAPMQDVFRTTEKFAQHKAGVLIRGESGTGKELVARAIHDLGPRKKKPFVAVNCGAIPGNLLESELFGHRRGAFTDAVRDKSGLFQEAHGGTLFLDEIGELPLNLQVKLLRAIQEEEVRRIGDTAPIKVDVRVIAATLRDLSADVARGLFREDLFYRLNVLPITLPPLRERPTDIPLLVEHFIREYNADHPGGQVRGVSVEAMDLLVRYRWPGNVRELENTIERAMVLCDGPLIEGRLFEEKLHEQPAEATPAPAPVPAAAPADEDLSIKRNTRRMEEQLIRRALETADGNRSNAAKLLGISHRALLYKIKEYGL